MGSSRKASLQSLSRSKTRDAVAAAERGREVAAVGREGQEIRDIRRIAVNPPNKGAGLAVEQIDRVVAVKRSVHPPAAIVDPSGLIATA